MPRGSVWVTRCCDGVCGAGLSSRGRVGAKEAGGGGLRRGGEQRAFHQGRRPFTSAPQSHLAARSWAGRARTRRPRPPGRRSRSAVNSPRAAATPTPAARHRNQHGRDQDRLVDVSAAARARTTSLRNDRREQQREHRRAEHSSVVAA